MKASEIRRKTDKDLEELKIGLLRESFNLQMQKATGQLNKSDQIKKIRKDIARLYTVITELSKK